MKKKIVSKIVIIGVLIFLIGASSTSIANHRNSPDSEPVGFIGLDAGLVGYWSFDDGAGFTAADDSGYNHNGEVNGAIWTEGISNSALAFNGEDQCVDIGDVETNIHTFNVWIKPDLPIDINQNQMNLAEFTTQQFRLVLGSTNAAISIQDVIPPDPRTNVENCLIDTNWHMLTLVWNDNLNRYDIYFDGILQPVIEINGHVSLMSCTNLQIGDIQTSPYFFDGCIDEIRIYDRSLSESEIIELFENPSGLTRALIFGKITNLNAASGNFITFEAENLRCLSFLPFEFNQYSAGEKIRTSPDYMGLLLEKFSLGVFKISIR